MFKNTFESISNFLRRDVQDKKETKEMAVLIRMICCIYIVYFLVMSIIVATEQHYFIALFQILAIGLLVGAFICTYENHTNAGLVVLNIVLIIYPTLLCLGVGYSLGFHIFMYLNILLIYYNKSDNMPFKWFYSAVICIYLMLITQFSDALNLGRLPSDTGKTIIHLFNILTFAVSIGVTAHSYCMKFNEAEEKLKRINENLERMANLDTLTGLSNRRHMNEYISGLVYSYNRTGKGFTIAIGDVDFFKKVNDTYGHDTGDYVLTTVAKQFTKFMDGKGHVARWGGEEFLFAFENMNLEKAALQMDALRRSIEELPMEFKEYKFNITMTFGMEEFNDRLGVEATINRADEKLYQGKTGGRNRVVI